MATVDTRSDPGTPFARFDEVTPAATIIAASAGAPIQRDERSNSASTEPTAMIWTSPRTSAIAVSRSRWISRPRAISTTPYATMAAAAA
jgi:hypothetical protein